MKKRGLLFFAAAVPRILAGLAAYHHSFPLDADLNGPEPAALQWLNRGRSVPCGADQLLLYQPVSGGNRVHSPLGLNGQQGYPQLSRGFTGRYQIDHSSHGTAGSGVRRRAGAALPGAERWRPHCPDSLFPGGGPYEPDVPASPVFLVSAPAEGAVPTGATSSAGISFCGSHGQESPRPSASLEALSSRHPAKNQAAVCR